MRLSAHRFNVSARGPSQSVAWRRSYLCPCRNPSSGAARQNCPWCDGRGVIWEAPQRAWSLLAGMRVAREWAAFGMFESGDVVLSIPSDSPLWGAGANDRVLMLDSTEPFDAVMTRTGTEKLAGVLVSVDRVFWLGAGNQMVEGDAPLQGEGGSLSWAPGAVAPPDRAQYTIAGRRNPEYFLFQDLPQDRAHFHGAALPRRVAIRRFDLFGR